MSVSRRILWEQKSERADRFARSFSDSRKNLAKLSDTGSRNVVRLLKELQDDIRSRLRQAAPGGSAVPFTTRIIPDLTRGINQSLAEWERLAGQEIGARLEDSFELGGGVTARAFRAAGVPIAFPTPSSAILATLSRDAANIITEVTSSLGDRINAEIQRSAVGLSPASESIRNIERLLKTSPEVRRGLRRRIGFAFQAEEITRTELGRVYSNAQQAASEIIAETIPGLRKYWSTAGDGRVRRGHREAEARYAPGGTIGPILIKDTFEVTDFSRIGTSEFLTLGGKVRPNIPGQRVVKVKPFTRRGRIITDRMLFTRDPSASAGNVISCRCTVLEVPPELENEVARASGIIQ